VGGRTKLTVSGEREATGARIMLLGFNRSCSSLHKTDGKKINLVAYDEVREDR